jgi:hypothetical protein
MDPTSAAAAAMYLPPTQDALGDTSNPAVAAAALMASNPMLPATTANPSSFYNIAPSATTTATTTTTSPIDTASSALSPSHNDPSTADLASSFMMPPNSMDPRDSMEKNYSFVAIPGANQRKRPRRRYDEIERLYHCTWPNCTKSYGTLNHLNAHVSMQKHVSFEYTNRNFFESQPIVFVELKCTHTHTCSVITGGKTTSFRIQRDAKELATTKEGTRSSSKG